MSGRAQGHGVLRPWRDLRDDAVHWPPADSCILRKRLFTNDDLRRDPSHAHYKEKGRPMRKYQLRTYRLRTEEAATDYLPHWQAHVKSLMLFSVETHTFFSVPSAPQDVDPETVTRQYMQSDVFKEDMTGFDVTQMVSVDTLPLEPGKGSPLT
jgi:hypothetical protein